MDEILRELEAKFETGDLSVAENLLRIYRRLGLEDKQARLELAILKPYIEDFMTAWRNYDRAGAYRLAHERLAGAAPIIDALNAARQELTIKSQELGLSPSHHLYRFHHIPDTNDHMERLATVHNASYAYAGRDDDSYFGNCDFTSQKDAEDFIKTVNRHHPFFRHDISMVKKEGKFIVSWHTYR